MAIRSTIPLLLAAKYHLHLESTRSILIGLAAREIWPLRSKYFCGEECILMSCRALVTTKRLQPDFYFA